MNASPQAWDEAHAVKCGLAAEVLRSSGSLRLRVMGWSMLPTVWPGDTLVVDSMRSSAVSVGDVVLFSRDRRLFVHRVVAKDGAHDSKFLTRGDAMPHADAPVSDHELLGKVSCILRNGRRIEPSKTLRLGERAVAALVRRSEVAARVVVGVHGLRQASQLNTAQNRI